MIFDKHRRPWSKFCKQCNHVEPDLEKESCSRCLEFRLNAMGIFAENWGRDAKDHRDKTEHYARKLRRGRMGR